MSPSSASVSAAVAALRRGELVGMPTETVYGLAADARNPAAIARIFALKGRPAEHPVIVHLSDAEQMRAWAKDIPEHAWLLAKQFWPGPMTLILRKQAGVLDQITGGQDTVGLRVPNHPIALQLLAEFDDGLAAPSANRFGHISPTTAQHVRDEFGDQLEMILDGGAAQIGIESSIIDARTPELRILRPGAITAAHIAHLTDLVATAPALEKPRVSGALKSHYAPRTPTQLRDRGEIEALTGSVLAEAAVILSIATMPASYDGIALSANPAEYANALYAALRALDARGAAEILIERPPYTPDWEAVWDRISRACASL
jgi:L-threonylcarbamoyladenylate synthase